MSVNEKAQVFQKVSTSPASKRKVVSELGVPRVTVTVGESDRGKEALRIEGILAHPETA